MRCCTRRCLPAMGSCRPASHVLARRRRISAIDVLHGVAHVASCNAKTCLIECQQFLPSSRGPRGPSRVRCATRMVIRMPLPRCYHSDRCSAQELAATRRVSLRELPRRELRVRGAAAQHLHATGACTDHAGHGARRRRPRCCKWRRCAWWDYDRRDSEWATGEGIARGHHWLLLPRVSRCTAAPSLADRDGRSGLNPERCGSRISRRSWWMLPTLAQRMV